MNCRRVRRYLYGYFKGELTADQTEEIKGHLDSCARCAKEAQEIESITLALKGDLETFVPSADFNEKLLVRIQAISSEVEVSREGSWWRKLLHEFFPSLRLRWALAGAAATVVLAWAVILIQKPGQIQPEYMAESGLETEADAPVPTQDPTDSAYQDLLRRLATTPVQSEGRAFVIDNLSISPKSGEDGVILPEDLYKRFIIERKSYHTAGRTGSHYVLPVVSTQPVSQKVDY
jgi:hypothetical protein